MSGTVATGIAEAHECWGANEMEKAMDHHNNSIGRSIGYGHTHLDIMNLSDLQILINRVLISISIDEMKVIGPLNAFNNEVIPGESSIIASNLICN